MCVGNVVLLVVVDGMVLDGVVWIEVVYDFIVMLLVYGVFFILSKV